jgi:hypothetical protein
VRSLPSRSSPTLTRDDYFFESADGPAWLVTFGGERNVVVSGDLSGTDADATVRGTSDQLYRWAWNRPTCAEAIGDPKVLASWRAVHVK